MRAKIEEMMKKGGPGGGLGLVLLLLSFVYGAVVRLRNTLYSLGLLKTRRLPCRVVSVGNVTVGGSGKTPVVMHMAGLLRERGLRVAILSRGYGRKTGRSILTVSDGEKILLTPQDSGDEPYLMAERLKGIPVVVGADRVAAGRYAIEKFSPDVIVLDDGFQHIRLHRDLNILLVDSGAGFGSGRLIPRGILREPLRGIKRADIAMVKGGGPGARDSATLKRFKIDSLGFRYAPSGVVDLATGEARGLETIRGRRCLAVAGVADPDSFFSTLEGLGSRIVRSIPYPDHHPYSRADLEVIKKAAAEAKKTLKEGAEEIIILTTEKDGVKLRRYAKEQALPPVAALSIDVVFDEPERLKCLLDDLLNR